MSSPRLITPYQTAHMPSPRGHQPVYESMTSARYTYTKKKKISSIMYMIFLSLTHREYQIPLVFILDKSLKCLNICFECCTNS